MFELSSNSQHTIVLVFYCRIETRIINKKHLKNERACKTEAQKQDWDGTLATKLIELGRHYLVLAQAYN